MGNLMGNKISWKQGLAIALGVPLLILPSIGYFNKYLGGFAIIVWLLSVLQGFAQNTAYAQLASKFPDSPGLPGFVQKIFERSGKNTLGTFLGGFTAWSYWLAWNPVLAIFTLLIGDYLNGLIPAFAVVPPLFISIVCGAIIFALLFVINYKGIQGGAVFGYILAAISLLPLFIITLLPIFTGSFHIQNITNNFIIVQNQGGNLTQILIFFGIMAMAQWSACAWETTAIYAPDYRNPKKDIPKALFFCGIICLFSFVFVQASSLGTLGFDEIGRNTYSPLLPLAQMVLGQTGAYIAIVVLIAGMVLIIQTAFLGSSKAMQSMAEHQNLPVWFGKTNRNRVPVNAMIFIALFNMFLITLKTPTLILAASALGYVIANGISLFAFWKVRKSIKDVRNESVFKAPRFWPFIALFFGVLNIPVYLVGLFVININDFGVLPACLGILVLLLYVGIWYGLNRRNERHR